MIQLVSEEIIKAWHPSPLPYVCVHGRLSGKTIITDDGTRFDLYETRNVPQTDVYALLWKCSVDYWMPIDICWIKNVEK